MIMHSRSSENHDPLFKVRPLIDSILVKFRDLEQEEYQYVDEQMIQTKSKSSMKQYIPKNPHICGYKVSLDVAHRDDL